MPTRWGALKFKLFVPTLYDLDVALRVGRRHRSKLAEVDYETVTDWSRTRR